MNTVMTIIIVGLILFAFAGFIAVILDQRAEARHYQELFEFERKDAEKWHRRVVELNDKLRELKKQNAYTDV